MAEVITAKLVNQARLRAESGDAALTVTDQGKRRLVKSAVLTDAQLEAFVVATAADPPGATEEQGDAPAVLPWRSDPNVLPATNNSDANKWAPANVSNRLVKTNIGGAGAADGDWIEWDVTLSAGTWRIDFLYVTYSAGAILQCSLDGVDVGAPIDGYSAAAVFENAAAIVGIVVGTTGKHTFRIRAAGKNAASAGFTIRLQDLSLRRTA